MEEDNKLEDWQKEVMPETVKRIQNEHKRQKELEEYLSHLKLVRDVQTGVAVGLTTAVILGGIFFIHIKGSHNEPEPEPYTISEVNSDTVTLTSYYNVKFGDTLTGISATTGIPVSQIQDDNDIKDANMIDLDQRLQLNYSIAEEDLEYYTVTTVADGRSVSEIAALYNTNVQTILNLNEGAIKGNNDGTYTILSNTLTVPNFITVEELKEAKGNQK